ncbi:transposase [Roseofilum sp. BLCC_M154]|uniref:Transposase n=1 Tax=Roseofilum acuticapitatum BLCC-M154 TaxID=3022444 RepID=A0ABT7AXQ0_9CYAN|nr:transposase [Roseofilum acuticapitatum]MDJ1171691.1 transposase [Roseofilum acuticapitatum BLCC-M154]
MKKNNQKIGCQQNLLHPDKDLLAILEYLCGEANKVFNCSVYLARQIWFKEHRFMGRAELCRSMKWNRHFGAMYASSAQQICNGVVESFKSFKELLSLFKKGKLEFKPKPPKYRKQGLFTVSYPKKWLKLTEKGIRVPLGLKVKAWFGIDSFYVPMAKNLDWDSIKEIRILPRNSCFYAEYVYGVTEQPKELDTGHALSIDHGLDNWLTCVDTQGHSFIIDGKPIKSKNQWYNKRVAILKEGKPQGFWSKQLAALTEKRNRQMRDAINKAARIVIDHCLKYKIGKIVLGWNEGQKQSIKLGGKINQEFVLIPTARLKNRIKQLSDLYGIQFIETEESYTSKASFLDGDFIPTYGEKPDNWKPSGKRIKRGLYQSDAGWLINADCNGAANILRKVARRFEIDLSRLGSGALTTPLRVRFSAKRT